MNENHKSPTRYYVQKIHTQFFWVTIFLSLIIVMRIVSTPSASLAYLFLAAFAFFGPVHVILALTTTWLLNMLNPEIVAYSAFGSLGRQLVFITSAISMLLIYLRKGTPFRSSLSILLTIVLGIIIIAHSIVFSRIPDVSILKAVNWVVVMVTILSAWKTMASVSRGKTISGIWIILVLVLIASIPLLGLPQGFAVNGTGFQGVLNHPQPFGSTIAVLASILIVKLFSKRSAKSWEFILIVFCVTVTALSEARTAGFALIIGLLISTTTVLFFSGRSILSTFPGLKNIRVAFIFLLTLPAIIISIPFLKEAALDFVIKRGESANLAEAYAVSRGGLFRMMQENIFENPLTGIGFGIATDTNSMLIIRDPVFNLPVSAAVEKGILPVAVVEELGVIVTIFVSIWFLYLLRLSFKGGRITWTTFVMLFLLNMGEATLFSPGGSGLIFMVLLGWAVTKNANLNGTG